MPGFEHNETKSRLKHSGWAFARLAGGNARGGIKQTGRFNGGSRGRCQPLPMASSVGIHPAISVTRQILSPSNNPPVGDDMGRRRKRSDADFCVVTITGLPAAINRKPTVPVHRSGIIQLPSRGRKGDLSVRSTTTDSLPGQSPGLCDSENKTAKAKGERAGYAILVGNRRPMPAGKSTYRVGTQGPDAGMLANWSSMVPLRPSGKQTVRATIGRMARRSDGAEASKFLG